MNQSASSRSVDPRQYPGSTRRHFHTVVEILYHLIRYFRRSEQYRFVLVKVIMEVMVIQKYFIMNVPAGLPEKCTTSSCYYSMTASLLTVVVPHTNRNCTPTLTLRLSLL